MSQVERLPEASGRNPWFDFSSYKDHQFNSHSEIKDNYDYVVVGAGFGGVFAALRLAELSPESSIALFDALSIGLFSSGRNAGFVSKAQIAKSLVGRQVFSLDDQKQLLHLNTQIVDKFEQIIKEKNLHINWRHDGMYKAVKQAKCKHDLKLLAHYFDELEVDYKLFGKEETDARLGTHFYDESMYIPETALINPAEAIRGFASALPKNVSVFENCPIIEVNEGQTPSIKLASGKVIKSKKIILTVNAFLKAFGIGKVTNPVAAIHSFGAVTRELTEEELTQFKDVQPWGITGTHPVSCTVRYTPYKRIFVRTDIAFATHLNINPERLNQSVKMLKTAFDRRFPELVDANFEYIYGGLISFTGNTYPLFGEVKQNVYAGVCGDGSGVTRAAILGHYLADLIFKVDTKELDYIKQYYHPSYLPPEPFRTIGADIAIAYKNFKAGIEV